MMDYICTKFHENILNDIRVMERTRKVKRRTDGRTDGGHDIVRPVFGGRIKFRRFYGKIPGNHLPVHFPLFLRASAYRTLETKIW